MKTDYSNEIKTLISSVFNSATSADKTAEPKTLGELHLFIIKVLPAKWIDQTDIYNVLEELEFTPSFGEKDSEKGMYYFVNLK
ncbi:hypothetical protein Leef1_1 [Polaribacter phage Leef_1]|uniref:Uncharacterized protein n=1 Tax=Polaribacter phage Leef_1 TaxID=2745684 RepID=A0A8E4ZDS8_9CAUD|nr:hypothetical protein M1M28_gp01 [Polaribacter phage Leef_1]QQV91372.1 hypothetical protein Leef1_1 [Polaribacter phage Leef_1]